MEPVIRKASMQDYEALCALWAEVDALHCEALPQIFQRVHGPARSRFHVERLVSSLDSDILIAETGTNPTGAVTVLMREPADVKLLMPQHYAVVQDLVICRQQRGKGIGRKLLQRAEEWALYHGACAVELTVWEFNSGALAFYEGCGYPVLNRRMRKPLGG